ncbi:MAG: serine hydrolase [Chloroflexi bacterium]|nr:MAG: serine hydrolase [Chloroflexota bacterium]
MTVGIYRDGEVETYAWGVESLETGFPVRPDTLFQIGSISKVFCTTLVMKLVDEGKLALDTPVSEYISDLELADPSAHDSITVRHTLNHSSGLWGDYFTDQGLGDDALGKSLPGFAALTQRHAPGELWTYCNSGFDLAGIAIERVLGTTFEAAMREKVFAPLGLERSFFFAHEAICYPAAVGHVQVEPKSDELEISRMYQLPRMVNPAGGIISTVGDLLKFAAFHMGDGTAAGQPVLTAQSLAEMQRPQIAAAGWADEWGLGWHIIHADGGTVIGHGGSTIGFQALLSVVPEKKFAIACLTNSSRGSAANYPITRWALQHYAGVSLTTPAPVTLRDDELAIYAGMYSNEWGDAEITVEDGGLNIVLTDRSPFTPEPKVMPTERMLPVGNHTFTLVGDEFFGMQVDFVWYRNDGDPHPRFLRMGRLYDRVG